VTYHFKNRTNSQIFQNVLNLFLHILVIRQTFYSNSHNTINIEQYLHSRLFSGYCGLRRMGSRGSSL